jgi:hypothetical protein
MAVYWRGSINNAWCANKMGPFDNACSPDVVYANSDGSGYTDGPYGPPGMQPCSNDTPARPFHDPAAGIP